MPNNYGDNASEARDYQSAMRSSYFYEGDELTNFWALVPIIQWLQIQQDFAQCKNSIVDLEKKIQQHEAEQRVRLPTRMTRVQPIIRVVEFVDEVQKQLFTQFLGKNEYKRNEYDENLPGFLYLNESQFKIYNVVKAAFNAVDELATQRPEQYSADPIACAV